MGLARWRIPLAGFLLALMGGASYAWGVFADPLIARFGWTSAEAKAPFTAFMVAFAASMVPAGKLQDRWGPRRVAAMGAVLFLVAYGLAALVGRIPQPAWLVLTYGLVGGTACGLTYAPIAPTVRKWFPDRPGFAISLALMGFGLAAAVFAPLKAELWLVSLGIEGTLLLLALLTSAVSLVAARLIVNPPPGWTPCEEPSGPRAPAATAVRMEATPGEAVRSSEFWVLWAAFACAIFGGLLAVGILPAFGTRVLGLPALEAATAVTVFAAVNGIGRPLAGWLADRIGAVSVLIVTYVVQAAALLTLPAFVVDVPTLYGFAAVFGWGFAATLALFPVLASVCFGVENLGFVYGLLFTAFGVGALGPVLGSSIFDATGSYTPAFLVSGALAGLAVALGTVLRFRYALR